MRSKNKKRKTPVLAQVALKISSDSTLSRIASVGVKQEVDHIYGYEKYPLDEVASELEERLYNPTYLGFAIGAILGNPKISNAIRTRLAAQYLDVVVSYLEGKMPKKTYEYWGGDAEPSCVVEAAAFLAERNEHAWMKKKEYVKAALSFTKDSSVRAKKSLLQELVKRINDKEDEKRDGRSLADILSSEELVVDSWLGFLKETAAQTTKKKGGDNRQLFSNLSALVDAEGEESSAGALCRLSSLDKDDLIQIFVDMPLFAFLRRSPSNRTSLYYDVGKVLVRERQIPFVSIVQALAAKFRGEMKKSKRVIYYADEPKLKALCKLALDLGEGQNDELLTLVHDVVKVKGVETETRLVLFKFLYENLDSMKIKKKLLAEASRFKSGKIRAWASSQYQGMID